MNKIYVGNLPFDLDAGATETALKSTFDKFGDITEVFLVKDRFSGDLKGFGFVTFANQSAAQAALQQDGQDFHGRKLRVDWPREKERTGGGRGDNRGGRGGRNSFNSQRR